MVTMPTVSMPISLLILAMTGAAPVPVPPPIPAVMNAILVPSLSMLRTSSMVSSAACRAFSGLLPAPSPSLPSCRCTGTGESLSAWASVLQTTNDTSCIPCLYMWFTALPPPPPTPMTLMMLPCFSLSSKSRICMFGLACCSFLSLSFGIYIIIKVGLLQL